MRRALCVFLLLASALPKGKSAVATWRLDVKARLGLQDFDREGVSIWPRQQGLLFLSPERMAIYQVSKGASLAQLRPRNASGGAGNFQLTIKILDPTNAHELKTLTFPTNAEFSEVIATHGGEFLVRTGDLLSLYSPDYQKLHSVEMPQERKALSERWQLQVTPSGKRAVLLHQQVFSRKELLPTSPVDKSQTDVLVLDTDTLATMKRFTMTDFFVADWAAGETSIVAKGPQTFMSDPSYAMLDFNGNWSTIPERWGLTKKDCQQDARAVRSGKEQLFVAYGCGSISLFSPEGEVKFSAKTASRDYPSSPTLAGTALAVEFNEHVPSKFGTGQIPVMISVPSHIDVYDWNQRRMTLRVDLEGGRVYYALSASGTLAVLEGKQLRVYQVPN